MRIAAIVAGILVMLGACNSMQSSRMEVYAWENYERIPFDHGKVIGTPKWDTAMRIKLGKKQAMDTLLFYTNDDSILMVTPGGEPGQMFKRFDIPAEKWKAKPAYGHQYFFIGNYVTDDLPGLYASFYCTKDRRSIQQLYYTNPGNMNTVILLSRDSGNILKDSGVLIDPRDEVAEPERPIPASPAPS